MTSAASEWSEQFVTEKPILFSSAMVLALLAGRKTVTRRIVTVPWHRSARSLPYEPYFVEDAGKLMVCCDEAEDSHGGGDFREYTTCMPAPYGRAGTRLWVKETFCPRYFDDGRPAYRADYSDRVRDVVPEPKWKPSIFMRRSESRITLEVTDVRVERLHAIDEADAIAEGIDPTAPIAARINGKRGEVHVFGPDAGRKAYALLWDAINGKRAPWKDNPWIHRIAFRRLP